MWKLFIFAKIPRNPETPGRRNRGAAFFAPEDVPDAISPPIRPVVEKYLRMRQKEKCPTDNFRQQDFRQQENLMLDILLIYDIVLNANELHLQIRQGDYSIMWDVILDTVIDSVKLIPFYS